MVYVDNNTENDKGKVLPLCVICNNVPEEGIAGGYRINRSFICNSCCNMITHITIGSPKYEEILGRIRGIYKAPRGLKRINNRVY